jgi:hypothetical protein
VASAPPGGTTVFLPENAPPVVEVTVARSCAGLVAATAAAASLCFQDPDPAVAPSPVDAVAVMQASSYNFSVNYVSSLSVLTFSKR